MNLRFGHLTLLFSVNCHLRMHISVYNLGMPRCINSTVFDGKDGSYSSKDCIAKGQVHRIYSTLFLVLYVAPTVVDLLYSPRLWRSKACLKMVRNLSGSVGTGRISIHVWLFPLDTSWSNNWLLPQIAAAEQDILTAKSPHCQNTAPQQGGFL